MQSSALKTIKKCLLSFTSTQSKARRTFLQFENQLPDTFSDFIEATALTGDFFLNSSNSSSNFLIFEKVFNLSSFNFLKYSSLVYFLFQMQYSPLTKFTHNAQLEQFRQA